MGLRSGFSYSAILLFTAMSFPLAAQAQLTCEDLFVADEASSKEAFADEGMWLFNRLPKKHLRATYGFNPSTEFRNHLMRSSVRFDGSSGAFVSSQGLLVTNHHVAKGLLQDLSTPQRDILADGYFAKTRSRELRVPNVEVDQLQSIRDVTKQVLRGLEGLSPAEAQLRKRANIARIEKATNERTGLKAEVVMLYLGAEYHLYQYKTHKDVRLVFAPEMQAARFGGEELNFEYPRYSLDVTFFRVYDENGKALQTEDFLEWSRTGPKAGELVFVSGHPGATSRLFTVAAMEFVRDVRLPFMLASYKRQIAALEQYGAQSPEFHRQTVSKLQSLNNSVKVWIGESQGLADPELFRSKAAEEKVLRAQMPSNGGKDAWTVIEQAVAKHREQFEWRMLLSERLAFPSRLFDLARTIARDIEERERPNTQRLPAHRDSRRATLKADLFSTAPIHKTLEIHRLADSFQFLIERYGQDHEIVQVILGGLSPLARAKQLIESTNLDAVEARTALFNSTKVELFKSKDPLVRLVLQLDVRSRQLQKEFDQEIDTPMQSAYGEIARLRYALNGGREYPDATSTLRLAFGRVQGYENADGQQAPWTFVQDVLKLEDKRNEDKTLPASWHRRSIQWGTEPIPYNFVSTADTIGGNSGSPVVNAQGELVGVNFDSNREKIRKQRYQYTEGPSRHVSVNSRGIIEILNRIYGANKLSDELGR